MAPKIAKSKKSEAIQPISQNSIAKPKSTKVRRGSYCHYGSFAEPFTGRTISMSSDFFELVAAKIGEWIDDLRKNGLVKQSSFTFEEFLMENKIPRITLLGWREKSPILDQSYKHAIECLGVMREAAALYFKVHPGMIQKVQHMYSDMWLAGKKLEEELKKPVTVIQSNAQIQQQGVDVCSQYIWEIDKLP